MVIFLQFFVLPLAVSLDDDEKGKVISGIQESDRSSLQSPSNRTRAKTRGKESSPFGFSFTWVVFARDDA